MNHFNKPILMSEESIPVYNLHGKQISSIPKAELKKIMLPKQNNQTLFKPIPINPNSIPINNLNSLSPVPIFPKNKIVFMLFSIFNVTTILDILLSYKNTYFFLL